MKTLANRPQRGYIQSMKYVLIVALSLTFIGCKKDDNYRPARSWDSGPVRLDSLPNDQVPDLIGTVGFHSRVFQVTQPPAHVWVKVHNDQDWQEIFPGVSGNTDASYTYDPVTKEVRFQYCLEQYGYAIYY